MVTMFFYEGYVCPVCKKKFHESEDIVACPECGAPHHRECWIQEGHCRYAEDHGTPHQWKRPEEPSAQPAPANVPPKYDPSGQVRTCSRCGKANPEFAEICSRCGLALKPPDWSSGQAQNNAPGSQYRGGTPYQGGYGEYTPFHMPIMDPFGGVSRDEKIDGVAAGDMVSYIGPNSAYYLPRFYRMSRNGSRTSWNWPAFLFTPYWLLYRKNYLSGGIVLFLSIIETLLNSFIFNTYILPALNTSSDAAMFDSLYTLIRSGQHSVYISIITLLFFISILVRVLFGLTANWIYKKSAVSRIGNIREKNGVDRIYGKDGFQDTSVDSDYRRELSMQGGVSLVLVAVASGIVWFCQMFYQALLMKL